MNNRKTLGAPVTAASSMLSINGICVSVPSVSSALYDVYAVRPRHQVAGRDVRRQRHEHDFGQLAVGALVSKHGNALDVKVLYRLIDECACERLLRSNADSSTGECQVLLDFQRLNVFLAAAGTPRYGVYSSLTLYHQSPRYFAAISFGGRLPVWAAALSVRLGF